MTIVQLQYILSLAQHKSFTIAAEKCFVTQPTLSMQIQKLEEELDVLIFDRSKKAVEITEVGKKIIAQAQQVVDETERIKDIVSQYKGYVGGDFKLGIIPTITSTLLPMFLNNFIKKYPDVHLKIEELSTQDAITNIKNGILDAAIVATPLDENLIIEDPLFYEPFVAYIPKQHPLHGIGELNVSDLNIKEILLLEDGHCFRDNVMNLCHSQSLKNQEKFEIKSGSFETLIKLADQGLGMTLVPYLHTLDMSDNDKQNLIYFSKPYPAREISLVYHSNELKSNITKALYNTITGIVRAAITFENVQIISPKRIKKG